MAKTDNPLPRHNPTQEHQLALTLYQAFQHSNDVMFYCNRSGIIADVNIAFTRNYGWNKDEVVGQNPRILRSPHTHQNIYKEMWSRILDPAIGRWRGELINRSREGKDIPVILTITAVRDEKNEIIGYMSSATNISEIRNLQERVAQSEALAQMGEMAAVVAHEIRNPLGSIMLAARQLASDTLDVDDRELVHKILRDESQRLNETLTNFLTFARPRPLKLVTSNLNTLVTEITRIASDVQTKSKSIKTKINKELPAFPFDHDQVRQVLWNIIINSIQAIGENGTIHVSTGKQDGFAFVQIEDNGPGVSKEARESLFQPFKTTKTHGTGLGLAIADRIIRAHGGRIEVGTPKHGALVTVYLPT